MPAAEACSRTTTSQLTTEGVLGRTAGAAGAALPLAASEPDGGELDGDELSEAGWGAGAVGAAEALAPASWLSGGGTLGFPAAAPPAGDIGASGSTPDIAIQTLGFLGFPIS